MEMKPACSTDTRHAPIYSERELGSAQGTAECILETLSDYGRVPAGIRERICSQKSSSQLRRWFLLARQVRSIEEFMNRM